MSSMKSLIIGIGGLVVGAGVGYVWGREHGRIIYVDRHNPECVWKNVISMLKRNVIRIDKLLTITMTLRKTILLQTFGKRWSTSWGKYDDSKYNLVPPLRRKPISQPVL